MLPSTLLANSILTDQDLNKIVGPLIELCKAVLPTLIGVVGALGAIWCVILGVKYARAEEPQEHEKAKNSLKNAIIGFLLIFVLIVALNLALDFFKDWWKIYLDNAGISY